MIVIVVIAILAAVSVVAYTGIQSRAAETTLKSDLRNAVSQLGVDKAISDRYPLTMAAANENKGLSSSNGTTLQYTSDGTTFCISALSSRQGVSPLHISNTGSIEQGLCSGHYTAETMPPSDCPTGFVPVPGNTTLGTNGFCVMKYEAKNVGGTATSQIGGTIWTGMSITTAKSVATAACSGCHLITEAEWMTIAANVLSVASNWTGGSVGSGYVYTGHSNNNPGSLLSASSNDNDGLFGITGGTGSGPQFNNKRTLTLTNGEVIWDLAGNADEFTQGTFDGSQPGGSSWDAREYSSITNWGSLPVGSRLSTIGAGSWGSAQGMGKIYSSSSQPDALSFRRGGYRSPEAVSGIPAGILSLWLQHGTSSETGIRATR